MSNLERYLNENHQNPENLAEDFSTKFGVNVKNEGDLYLFKYGIISAKWEPETLECRGSILKFSDNDGWEFKSRPFDKFFNQHEGHCPVFDPKVFNEDLLEQSCLATKADGTCIQLWHDGAKWRASTLGTITPLMAHESNLTFDQLFFKTVGNIIWDDLVPELTYIFELCTEENRIVTQYPADHAVLLGVRDRVWGDYYSLNGDLEDMIEYGPFREANVVLPQLIYPTQIGLRSLEDVKQFIEESAKTDKYGKYPEGFVLYDLNCFHPLAKMKNSQYVSLHSFGGGDIAHSKNQIIDAVFLGFVDDIYDVLSDRLREFADKIKQEAESLLESTLLTAENLQDNCPFESRKEYAAFIQQNADKRVHSFFFKNAEEFMTKEIRDVSPKFRGWLNENYKKFDWKNEE